MKRGELARALAFARAYRAQMRLSGAGPQATGASERVRTVSVSAGGREIELMKREKNEEQQPFRWKKEKKRNTF